MKRLLQKMTITLSTVLLFTSPCSAGSTVNPFVLLDAAEFSSAMSAAAAEGVFVLDARPAERYEDGHIKGSVNIFAPDLEKNPSLLKAGKGNTILVYCDGVKCDKATGTTAAGLPCRSIEAILPTKSGKAAMAVVNQGYSNVSVLYEGFPGWDLKGFEAYSGKDDSTRMVMPVVSAMELKASCDAKADDKIIDLRLPGEFAAGHIPGAVNMPFAAFVVNAGSLGKNKRLIVYGSTVEQGHGAVRRLQKLGFTRVARADFEEWRAAGLMIEKK